MTVRTALFQGQKLLEDAKIAAARLTAEVLLMHATGHDREWLYAHGNDDLIEVWWIHYGRYLHQRIKGAPTQHITGRQEFFGREFRVTPDVLIPRPETEHLVEAALSRIQPGAAILDVGTGSGAIAITIALEKNARVFATDVSATALAVASANARNLKANISITLADLTSCFAPRSFDLIVSNPPYVPAADQSGLQREVRDYEPHVALFAGPTGLEIYERLIA